MLDHPLLDIFSCSDFDRLKHGRCVESNGVADINIASMLTEKYYAHPNSFNVSLAKWLKQSITHGEKIYFSYKVQLRNAVSNRSRFFQVAGELMAAYFLEVQQGFQLEYIERKHTTTPDFRIQKQDVNLTVEVKTLVGGISINAIKYAGAYPSPAPIIRNAINKVRKRKQFNVKGNNLVLLIDCWRPGIDRDHIVDALYGDPVMACMMGPSGPLSDWYGLRERNVYCQVFKNTWISIVGVLGWNGFPECKGHFIHNAYAISKLPRWIFDPWPQFLPDKMNKKMIWYNLPKQY